MKLKVSAVLIATAMLFTAAPAFPQAKADAKSEAKETKGKAKAAATPAASDADIAAAKAANKVWVNTGSDTKAYHYAGSRYYGKTKQGKFMTEDEAKKAGYHAAGSEDASGMPKSSGKAKGAAKDEKK